MKILNRCMAAALAVIIIGSGSVYAYRERTDNRGKGGASRNISTPNDIFCYDFSKGEIDGLTLRPHNDSKIFLGETKGINGKKQTALVIDDKEPGENYSGPGIKKSFDAVTSGKLGFDMRFKLENPGEKTYTAMQIAFNQGSTMILRIYVDGYSLKMAYIPGGSVNEILVPGEWYRIRLVYDVDSGTSSFLVESDALKNGYIMYEGLQGLVAGTGYKIDNVDFSSRFYTGQWYIDYFRMDKGNDIDLGYTPPPFKHPAQLIEPPITAAPVMIAIPKRINVNVNGEYMYYATEPVFDGEDIMVTTDGAFRSFNMTPVIGSGYMSAMLGDKEIRLTAGSADITIGSEDKKLTKAVAEKNGENIVSINALAEALGYTSEWNADENTLYITGGAE